MGANDPRGKHVLSWLRERGALSATQYEGALHHAIRTGERAEEAVIETGAINEAELLRLLAARYKTRFVTTERLKSSHISRRILDRIPRKLAEHLLVFPIVFDKGTQTLSIVVAAPGEDDVEKQIQVVTGVRLVRAYVARPAAIRAAIEKFYDGNARAFEQLSPHDVPAFNALDMFDAPVGGPSSPTTDVGADFADPFTHIVGPAAPEPGTGELPFPAYESPGGLRPLLATSLADGRIPADPYETSGISMDEHLETLNVFVSLLEQERGPLRGHSGQVARLCRMLAERAGLESAARDALTAAAYLHDVGKMTGGFHLTPLNVARAEGHRSQAMKSRMMPVKLFESAGLPDQTKKILGHMYERFDGQGFPDRLAGKDIPYGSRVLAIVETYTDLTTNELNPYQRALSQGQALSVLRDLSGQLFDPALAELLVLLAAAEQGDEAGRPRTLLVDPDAEETTVLELRLIEHGFHVDIARSFASAKEKLAADPPQVIVTEVDLGGGPDGFALLAYVSEIDSSVRPTVIVFTARSDRESVSRGFELGAADYLVKPASAELVATKAGQALEGAMGKRAGGVSGSLVEMSLPDVVQILANGKRRGRLQLSSGGKRGEIHFKDGQIYDASFANAKGEEAFYAMLKLTDGSFVLDPSFKPDKRVIYTSPEGLLLEGMRRLDEDIP